MKHTSDLPYPFNVQRYVLGDLSDAIDNPDEVYCAIEYALTKIPERERQAVLYRYRDNMKYTEIAEKLGCSSARCQQIVGRALRRLKCYPTLIQSGIYGEIRRRETNPYNIGYSRGAYYATAKLSVAALKLSPEIHEILKLNLVETIGDIAKMNYVQMKGMLGWQNTKEVITQLKNLEGYDDTSIVQAFEKDHDITEEHTDRRDRYCATPIYELGLPLRAVNALRRSNIISVEELAATSLQQLHKIRNMGQKTIDEIVEILRSRGIELKESEIEA